MSITVFLLAVLSACDPVITYEKAIVNATGSELLLTTSTGAPAGTDQPANLLSDSTTIGPSVRQLITEGMDIGGTVETFENCPGFPAAGDTLFVQSINTPGQILVLTQRDFDGVHRETSKNVCDCTLEITPEMFDN